MTISTMDVKVGDSIGRQVGKNEEHITWLTVTDVTETSIFCNLWEFDRQTGAEIDHERQWGPQYGKSGSFITRIKQALPV
jgi:hypothetical protein